jgi:prephenate dehydratase
MTDATRVVFQGIAGAYSEQAVRQYFGPEVGSVPCGALDDLFPLVDGGDVDYAMLPVENAIAGSVTRAYELLMEHDLRVYAEVILRVQHMLLALPGTTLDDVVQVRSHPQALAQCQRYLGRHGLKGEPTFDTAGAARDLAANPEPGAAAIASELAAELYDLEILDRDIEDFTFNYTRFFVLAREDECLGEFAKRGVNLAKIESRPRLNRPWQYFFYLDFEGHCQDPECEAAIMALLRRSLFVKLLGSYPAATTPVPDNY